MMTAIWSASLTIQEANPTPKLATPNANAQATQDLQAATRELRDAITKNIQHELAVAGRQQGPISATTPEPPTPQGTPRVITIRGRDGTQTITLPPHPFDNTIPPQAVDISVAFFLTVAAIIIGLPLARAFARWMDRRATAPQIPSEVSSQLAHLNQAVDAIAVEVERISEGQRFTTRLLSEQRDTARQTLPAGTNR